jgi:NTE family protein
MELPSQLGRGIYALGRFDTGNVWADDIDPDDLRYGFTAGIGADTSAGPIYLTYGWADGGFTRIYFALGSDF